MTKKMTPFPIGWPLVLLLALLPDVLWVFAAPLASRFASFAVGIASIGQLLGLTGAAMFALNLLLSARLRSVEALFGGLNRVYRRHSHMGQIALMLLLFHPLLLLPKYVDSWSAAAAFLLPSADWAKNFGSFALIIMLTLIIVTLYLRPRYNLWKITHKFMGGAFFLASLHIFLIPSDTAIFMPLRLYILGLAVVGLMAFCYRTLFGRWLVKKHNYVVTSVEKKNRDVVEIVMMPQQQKFAYAAGQFLFINFTSKTVSRESHPFSIASSPETDALSIVVKNSGDYTSSIANVAVGDVAHIEGPFGVFTSANGAHHNQIWIAGGIGVTPFLGMARSLGRETGSLIDLYYCVRNEQEAVYMDELQRSSPRLRLIPFYSDTQGYITAEAIKKESGTLEQKDLFICAPPPMIRALRKQFVSAGVAAPLIHSEEFSY